MAKKSAIQKNLNKETQVKKNKSRRDRLKAICSVIGLFLLKSVLKLNSNCLRCPEMEQKLGLEIDV